MEKRNIPKKNYIIYSAIVIGTIILVIYASSWYKTISDYNENQSVMTDVLAEIGKDSLSSFLIDNPDAILYVSSSSDSEVKSFEKKFKKYITDEDLSSRVVYINLALEENEDFLNTLKNNYLGQKYNNLEKIISPNLIFVIEGEITDIMYTRNSTKINLNDAKQFLNRNELLND